MEHARLSWAVISLMLGTASFAVGQRIITTAAGTDWIFTGDGKPAENAPIGQISQIATNPAGELFIAESDNNLILKVDLSGRVRVIAGNGIRGFSGDGGNATDASLNFPIGIAVDARGVVYFSDSGNYRIRKIDLDGTVSTIAGSGVIGYSGDGGPARLAAMGRTGDIALRGSGEIYLLDVDNHRVRKLDTGGTITRVAGTGQRNSGGDGGPAIQAGLDLPYGIAVDPSGTLYISELTGHRVRKVNPAGIINTYAGTGVLGYTGDGGTAVTSGLTHPEGLTLDAAGNLYIADAASCRIRKVTPAGIISTYAGGVSCRFGGDGGPALSGSLFFPHGLAVDGAGNLYIGDRGNSRVRKVTPNSGTITTYVGNGRFRATPDGTPAASAVLATPGGVAVDASNNLYISNSGANTILRVSASGQVTKIAGLGPCGFTGDGGAALGAIMCYPFGLVVARDGSLYYADVGPHRVRKVSNGIITSIAGSGVAPGYSGDNGPAALAVLNTPISVAVDSANNVYVSDQQNHRIRKISPSGTITTFAGNGQAGYSCDACAATASKLNYPTGIAIDSGDNLYIADLLNHRVRRVTPAGVITTIAGTGVYGTSGDGGQATLATLGGPTALAFDRAGNLFLAEEYSHRIRMIAPNGILTAVAGNLQPGLAGDNGPGTSASLNRPVALAVDSNGVVYVADFNNSRIRSLLVSVPSFNVSTTSLSFGADASGKSAPAQNVALSSFMMGSSFSGLPYRLTASAPWLKLAATSAVMPAAIQVSADPASLDPGVYSSLLTIDAPGANPPSRIVSVSFTVSPSQPPVLAVDTKNLSFSFQPGASPFSNQLTVNNGGGGILDIRVAATTESGGAWLSFSPDSASARPWAPAPVTVTADPGNLEPGTYSGALLISSPSANQEVSVPVVMVVSKPGPQIVLSQTTLAFRAVARGGNPLPHTVSILNSGAGTLDWTVKSSMLSGGGWMNVTPSSGKAAVPLRDVSPIQVAVDSTNLAPGDYYGLIQVEVPAAANSPQSISVLLTVLPQGSNPGVDVRPSGMIFTGVAGGSNPGSQNIEIGNLGTAPLNFSSGRSTADGKNWFVHQPTYATVETNQPGRIVVQPDFSGLEPGVRRGALTILLSDGTTRTVDLLTILAPSSTPGKSAIRDADGCTPNALLPQFTTLAAGFQIAPDQPVNMQVRVVDSCGDPVRSGAVVAYFSNGDPQINLVHVRDGVWSASWQPKNTSSPELRIAVQAFTIQGQNRLGGQAGPITGSMGGTLTRPQLAPGGLVSAASYSADQPVAPGALITIFGRKLSSSTAEAASRPLQTVLAGTELILGGKSLPLLYASDGQVSAQIPLDVAVNSRLQLLVRREESLSVPEEITVSAAQPAVFTVDQSGKGQGHIYNGVTGALADAAAPVTAGDVVVIYCGGLGTVDPPVPSGAVATGLHQTTSPMSVSIGGKSARVDFAGLAPGFVGLYQINAVVPEGISADNRAPVVLSLAGQQSPPVTMAVR